MAVNHHPFQSEDIAADYEAWYMTKGKKADRQEKALLESLLRVFSGARTILEIGCGTGHFTDWFQMLGYRCVGLDRSREMIREGLKTHQIPCVEGDGSTLPFESNIFDVVAFITTLEFLNNPQQALTEALRVAQRGLLLGVINKHSLLGWRYRRKGGPIWGEATFYSPRELKQMVSNVTRCEHIIKMRTTLWPLFSSTSIFPWGGFIGLSIVLLEKE
jgi:ubiquinone/menaquinone biosynthesis C-methylase UbiE